MKCAVCDRDTTATLGPLGVAVCTRCARTTQHVRTARPSPSLPHVYTFYVRSMSDATIEYAVKRFRRQVTCTCPDFVHRGQVLQVPCKHVRLVRLLARAAGGWTKIPPGTSLRFRLSRPGEMGGS